MPEITRDDLTKKLSIKIGTAKRCGKEVESYKMEAELQTAKIKKLEQDGGCPHIIKKQYEVLEETNRMLPDCTRRLEMAQEDLRLFLKANEANELDSTLISEANNLINA